jgi:hypothetical protein
MAKNGSINNRIANRALTIARGRDYINKLGHEEMGVVIVRKGVAMAIDVFKEAKATKDVKVILQAELTFIGQELLNCNNSFTRGSLEKAETNITDALNSYSILSETASYPDAEQTHSTSPKYRIKSAPRDAFHNGCESHMTRLRNTVKSTEIPDVTRELYQLRIDCLKEAKEIYIKMQHTTLGIAPKESGGKSRGRGGGKEIGD